MSRKKVKRPVRGWFSSAMKSKERSRPDENRTSESEELVRVPYLENLQTARMKISSISTLYCPGLASISLVFMTSTGCVMPVAIVPCMQVKQSGHKSISSFSVRKSLLIFPSNSMKLKASMMDKRILPL